VVNKIHEIAKFSNEQSSISQNMQASMDIVVSSIKESTLSTQFTNTVIQEQVKVLEDLGETSIELSDMAQNLEHQIVHFKL